MPNIQHNPDNDPYITNSSNAPNTSIGASICTICYQTLSAPIVKQCNCSMHLQCFVDTLIQNSTGKCTNCGLICGHINIDLYTAIPIFEKYIMKLFSGILFLMPIFLCNMGMDIVNIFDIITWYIIRMPIFKYIDIKKHIILHILGMLIPISIGMIYEPLFGYHRQYMYGMHFITSFVIDFTLLIGRILLFISANLLIVLILCIDINRIFLTIKRLSNHITFVYKLIV